MSSSELHVPKSVVDAMLQHCRAEAPNEACGVLIGHGDHVEDLQSMTNLEASPVAYRMDPYEQLQLQKRLRQSGQELVAIYHSHVATQAYPSVTDIQQAYDDRPIYIICSLRQPQEPDVRGFRIQDGKVSEANMVLLSD